MEVEEPLFFREGREEARSENQEKPGWVYFVCLRVLRGQKNDF
jgi:hypothetical protein